MSQTKSELLKQIEELKQQQKATEDALRIAKSNAKKTKEVSDYFLKSDNSEYKFKNLNSSCAIIENNNEDYLNLLRVRLNKDKFTLNEFHKELIKDLNTIKEN